MKGWGARSAAVLGCLACLLSISGGLAQTSFPQGNEDVPVVDVYRMLQYDLANQPLGSRKSSVSMLAVPSNAGDLSRKCVVVDFKDVTNEKLNELLHVKNAGALLIILPSEVEKLPPKQIQLWREVEQNLISREIMIPVYFAFDGEQAKQVQQIVDAGAGDTQLVVHADKAVTKSPQMKAVNYQGWLAGSNGEEAIDELPTIAVVAHWDSFGVAPELAVGVDSNGSGFIALLQLARLFHRLYSVSRTQGGHNLIFILTAAGKQDFAGSKYWLANSDAKTLEKIDFALCLDSIGGGDELYLHSSKPAKDESISKVYNTLSSSAEKLGTKLSYVHKKINISDPVVSWEHEQFSRKRILAGTLSRHSSHEAGLRASIMDRSLDDKVLQRNIKIVANAIASMVYKLDDKAEIFGGSNTVQGPFVEAWSDALSRVARMAVFMNEDGVSLLQKAEAILKESTNELSRQSFPLDKERVYYVGGDKAKMSVFSVRPLSFDLVMSVAVLAYLLIMLVVLQGWTEAQKTLIELVKGGKGRKKRA